MEEEHGIGTYPVGLFQDIWRPFSRRNGRRYLARMIEARNWRAVRNYFNGYLAEWHYPPNGLVLHKCGHGWTRNRARRSLGRAIVEANLSPLERAWH